MSLADRSVALPIKLKKAPLVEAVFELRFTASRVGVSELLPGLIYRALGSDAGEVQPLPAASIPRELRSSDLNLKYQPTLRMIGEGYGFLIGDHSFAVSKSPPYEGWSSYRTKLLKVLSDLHATKLIKRVDRTSFKCVNVVETDPTLPPLSTLDIDLRLGPFEPTSRGFRLRSEMTEGEFVVVLDIASSVNVETPEMSRSGVLVSIDAIRQTEDDLVWTDATTLVDTSHDVAKRAFFSLLTTDTLTSVGPVWSNE